MRFKEELMVVKYQKTVKMTEHVRALFQNFDNLSVTKIFPMFSFKNLIILALHVKYHNPSQVNCSIVMS